MQNQLQIQAHNKTLIPASVTAIQYPHSTRSSNWSLTNNFHREDNMVATIHNDPEKFEPPKLPIKTEYISTTLIVDSGIVCNILNKSLAAQLVSSNPYAIWVREINKTQLRTISN